LRNCGSIGRVFEIGRELSRLSIEIRGIGAARMRSESDGHTWQPTALINELYLELVKIRSLRAAGPDEEERAGGALL